MYTKTLLSRISLHCAAILTLFSLTGCFQVETRVKLHPDGSATITERFQLSRRILELEKPGATGLASALEKKAVTERMKHMGEGVTLLSHKTREGEAGSRESVSVLKIPDITKLRYASPYFAIPGYPDRSLINCRIAPRLKTASHVPAGLLEVTFNPVNIRPVKATKKRKKKPNDEKPKPGPSPLDLQALRHLQPVVRDMLQGARFKFTLETYCGLSVFRKGLRNKRLGTREYDLIDFSYKNLDAFGGRFLENEEILLELERMDFNGGNLQRHIKGYADNHTLPLFHIWGSHWWRPPLILIRPSKPLFDKLMAGKLLDGKPADFARVGWKGKAKK